MADVFRDYVEADGPRLVEIANSYLDTPDFGPIVGPMEKIPFTLEQIVRPDPGYYVHVYERDGVVQGFSTASIAPRDFCTVIFIMVDTGFPREQRRVPLYRLALALGLKAREAECSIIGVTIPQGSPTTNYMARHWQEGRSEVDSDGLKSWWLQQPLEKYIADCEGEL